VTGGDLMVSIMGDVMQERMRQIVKWGGPEADGVENPSTPDPVRLRTLVEEVGEVAEAMGRPEDGNGKRDLRTELIQVAAVAVAWIEGLDRAVSQ
jgi:NTP pyrophosphatase (non-canonical NTP hydrolase)